MASRAPPIPPEQRAFPGQKPHVEGRHMDRRERETGDQSGQPGDAGVNTREQGRQGNLWQNTREQGRQGNLWQNTHNQGHQQDR